VIKLPRFPPGLRVADDKGLPSHEFSRWWDDAMSRLENSVNDIIAVNEAQDAMLKAISYTVGASIEALAGTGNSTITISAHTRVYPDGSSDPVAFDGGSIPAQTYATAYYIYTDDQGGAVTYLTTTDPTAAVNSIDNPQRLFVGAVETPAADGDPPVPGRPASPATQAAV